MKPISITPPAENTERRIIGCMTGTSLDAIDASLVNITGSGLKIRSEIVKSVTVPIGSIVDNLRALAVGKAFTAFEISRLKRDISQRHIEAISYLIEGTKLDLIVVHGQTVFHQKPLSWQLINPTLIAHEFATPVLFDLRAADIAHGGEGAPITPLSDFIMFRDPDHERIVVNLGGFCNITRLPKDDSSTLTSTISRISGKDVCVCNQLLDSLARDLIHQPFDQNGYNAALGNVNEKAYQALFSTLLNQSEKQTSLGTGDEVNSWVNYYMGRIAPHNLLRTACAGIAKTISKSVLSHSPENSDCQLILAGGGVHNKTLLDEIESSLHSHKSKIDIFLSDDFGIPTGCRESIAMAVLGALCWDRVPITLPQVTNCKGQFLSGSWVFM